MVDRNIHERIKLTQRRSNNPDVVVALELRSQGFAISLNTRMCLRRDVMILGDLRAFGMYHLVSGHPRVREIKKLSEKGRQLTAREVRARVADVVEAQLSAGRPHSLAS